MNDKVHIKRINDRIPSAETKGSNRGINRPGMYLVKVVETQEVYTGSSACVDKRVVCHVSDLKNGIHKYDELQSAYDANKEIEISIVYTPDLEVAQRNEQMAVDTGSCLNKATLDVTKPALGRPPSELNIQRIKETHTGKTVSEETRRKLSEANTGKTLSDERRQHLSTINTGKKLSTETIEKLRLTSSVPCSEEKARKISEAKKGKGIPQEALDAAAAKRSVKVLCNGVEYESYSAAAAALDTSDVNIRNWVRSDNPKHVEFKLKET